VAKKRLNTYENQATFSVILAVIGALAAIAAAVFVYQRFDSQVFGVKLNPESLRMPAIRGAVLLAVAAASIGLALSVGVFFELTKYTYAIGSGGQP
jgi:hypothetical protein